MVAFLLLFAIGFGLFVVFAEKLNKVAKLGVILLATYSVLLGFWCVEYYKGLPLEGIDGKFKVYAFLEKDEIIKLWAQEHGSDEIKTYNVVNSEEMKKAIEKAQGIAGRAGRKYLDMKFKKGKKDEKGSKSHFKSLGEAIELPSMPKQKE